MSGRKSTIIIWAFIAITVISFGVLLLDPFDAVQSFSVVAQEGDDNASSLAAIISQAMFAVLVVTTVGCGVLFCFRVIKRQKDTPQRRP